MAKLTKTQQSRKSFLAAIRDLTKRGFEIKQEIKQFILNYDKSSTTWAKKARKLLQGGKQQLVQIDGQNIKYSEYRNLLKYGTDKTGKLRDYTKKLVQEIGISNWSKEQQFKHSKNYSNRRDDQLLYNFVTAIDSLPEPKRSKFIKFIKANGRDGVLEWLKDPANKEMIDLIFIYYRVDPSAIVFGDEGEEETQTDDFEDVVSYLKVHDWSDAEPPPNTGNRARYNGM